MAEPRLATDAGENRELILAVLSLAHSDRAQIRELVIRIVTARDYKHDDPEVTVVLQSLLTDTDIAVRGAAITAVAQQGHPRVEDVREWLRDADPKVVDSALSAVPWLDPDGEQVVPELLLLVDTVSEDRLSALMTALCHCQASAKAAFPRLMRRMESPGLNYDPAPGTSSSDQQVDANSVRRNFMIVQALVELHPQPSQLVPILKRALSQNRLEFSQQAAAILAKVDLDEARRLTTQLMNDIESAEIRGRESDVVTALGALSGLGPSAHEAVPLLIRLIEQEHDRQRRIAYYSIEALGGIGLDAAPVGPPVYYQF